MANVEISDGANVTAAVTSDKELLVITASYPPLTQQKVQPFRQYFTDDGTATGTSDMGVDGSSTNVDYYIPADSTNDRYITEVSFAVGYGNSGQPFQWGDGTALSNGTRFFYNNLAGDHDIHDGIKNNEDMFRLTFNRIDSSWEVRGVGSLNDYGYYISMDLTRMGLPYGIKLDAGTAQKLTLQVRDNAGTDADIFTAIAYGFERFL